MHSSLLVSLLLLIFPNGWLNQLCFTKLIQGLRNAGVLPAPGIGTREGAALLEEKINLIVAKLIKGSLYHSSGQCRHRNTRVSRDHSLPPSFIVSSMQTFLTHWSTFKHTQPLNKYSFALWEQAPWNRKHMDVDQNGEWKSPPHPVHKVPPNQSVADHKPNASLWHKTSKRCHASL